MADGFRGLADYRLKLVDLGDGTYAEAVSPIAGSSSLPTVTQEVTSTIATRTSVAASTSTVTLLAANANRKMATVFNHTATATLFVALGSGGSNVDFTTEMPADSYYEVPGHYTGVITGVWSAASGAARMTELT